MIVRKSQMTMALTEQTNMANTYGIRTTGIYHTWKGMRQRCRNPRYRNYDLYGGRGITICDRWDSFDNFAEDMLATWFPGVTIDRIDNDGDYTPENCQWLTKSDHSGKTVRHWRAKLVNTT